MYRVVEVGSFSSPKPSKEINEDFLLFPAYDSNSNIVFAVADGVGSLDGANKASECAINTVSKMLNEKYFSVESALHRAKEEIDNLAFEDEQFSQSATTLTLVQVGKKEVIIGHIGDCRAYTKKSNKLVQLTKDHTRYQELLDSDEHSVRKLRQHKERLSSVITKALSSQSDLDFDILTFPTGQLYDGDSIVISLMSDGAYDHWHKRARFSESTMNSPSAFVNSLRKRIEKEPTDDFSCLTVKLKL